MTDAAIVEGLSKSKIATELTPSQCEVLAATMTVRDLEQGEVLVREGDIDDHLYVVVSGSLGVVKAAGTDNEITLNVMRPGDVVGELSFLDGATRFASLVALSRTHALGLSRGDLEALLERDPHLVYRIMRSAFSISARSASDLGSASCAARSTSPDWTNSRCDSLYSRAASRLPSPCMSGQPLGPWPAANSPPRCGSRAASSLGFLLGSLAMGFSSCV
jgi:hypothetical protein